MAIERTRWKKNERNKPYHRVYRAMERVSRNKYLRPEDVRRIGLVFSKDASPAAWRNVYKAAINECSEAVGMINGRPVFMRFEEGYSEAVKAAKEKDETKILIQFLKIKGNQK